MEERIKLFVIFGIGMAAVCYSLILWLGLRRCGSWPSTDGTIIRSDKTVTRHNFQKIEKVTIHYTYFVGCRYESEAVKVRGFIHAAKEIKMLCLQSTRLGRRFRSIMTPTILGSPVWKSAA